MKQQSDRKTREILATVETLPAPDSTWKKVERESNVFGAIAIPVTVAVLAWKVQLQTVEITTKQQAQVAEMSAKLQTQIADATARQEYVKLAVSILKDPIDVSQQTRPQPLREWAVRLLEKNSPVELTPEAKQGLESGKISFPVGNAPCFPAVSVMHG